MEHYIVLFSCIFLQCLAPIFGDELLAVTAIVNHGDTIPHKFYSTDPYQNSTIWGKKLGQLSIVSQKKSQLVRSGYVGGLPSVHHNPENVSFEEEQTSYPLYQQNSNAIFSTS
ncbi:hypothetical protein HHI36_021157 [Cryptolaemus montrouzieri]|uniref:Uncharacterized protein n=1 Tax=Cryptolaemus montrouzieri TaxID=559131 RepID=A0ABD2MVZ0_9CUCU